MSMVGTKRDNRVFPKQDDSQNDLIMEIVSDILSAFDSGATAVYIEAVYDKKIPTAACRLFAHIQSGCPGIAIDGPCQRKIHSALFLSDE